MATDYPETGYRRRKQPELVHRALLDHAARLAVEHGLAAVTVQAVAEAAGVTKGGLLHHFPSKQALIDAVFADLLEALDRQLDARIAADPEPRGAFTRAYLASVFDTGPEANAAAWAALAISMLTDPHLRRRWSDWVEGRQERHRATDGTPALAAIRLAADGIWLADLTGVAVEERAAMRDFLIRQTRANAP
ncbi:TetR/AcrR family transcriptional regulator [Pleomorphomonas carboxyditropha]|uniref:TetR family transcriptional regulator n=1 Tax=Pleomorphomonas carboxyditropha TaxID=2023338 RepID=A0A2G9WSM2_9HYPH|nr:TetR/AcrR family transcriptional regulator [Pleomorphomonas carboxyditropha]PIO97140.1 TetR family transcriptional regulator [Pleomorphomonas carboxyditropha]